MQVVKTVSDVREAVAIARDGGERIGCVPTMGALHAGHMSLVEDCRERSDFVVLTIFVNPTQFSPTEDLSKYPRPLEDDLAKCREADVDLVFTPEVPMLYPQGFETYVELQHIPNRLEGAHRPTHFRGVATIVTKLFNIVQPDVACFGQKDYQQQTLIRRMVRDLDMPVEIVVCPTVRERDGLALSSRNVYLSESERRSALSLYASLQLAQERIQSGETDLHAIRTAMHDLMASREYVSPDYVSLADPNTLDELDTPVPHMVALVAARVGKTRLIDNLVIEL
ncbi:MAG: pantoate--beta-alanine ligase [Planctomycetaceae bacterium]|nr:pantoate--beta-alanine ligase [Planctomycetaceae bacterium]